MTVLTVPSPPTSPASTASIGFCWLSPSSQLPASNSTPMCCFPGGPRWLIPASSRSRAPGWTVDGHLVRTVSGDVVVGSLQPADEYPAISAGGVANNPEREATVLEHLRSLREIVATEREVMLRYLGAPAEAIGPSASLPAPALADPATAAAIPAASSNGHNRVASRPSADELEAAPTTAAPSHLRGDALLALVLQLVADRTGYPTDMLDPDLDLEADLSIDSIKRIEIIGDLAERIGLDAKGDDGIDDSALEALAQLKSLREIVVWIDDLDPESAPAGPAPAAPAPGPGTTDPSIAPDEDGPVIPAVAARHIVNDRRGGPSGHRPTAARRNHHPRRG